MCESRCPHGSSYVSKQVALTQIDHQQASECGVEGGPAPHVAQIGLVVYTQEGEVLALKNQHKSNFTQLHLGRSEACTHRVVVQHELHSAELDQLPHTAVCEQTRAKEETAPFA